MRMYALVAVMVTLLLLPAAGALALSPWERGRIEDQLAALEANVSGRLGIMAYNVRTKASLTHRADERFPFCSTFKAVLAGAVLKKAEVEKSLLQKKIAVPTRLVSHSPVTATRTGQSMTVAELCAASVEQSDNTATNMLLDVLGDRQEVRIFARKLGDALFRLDRDEPELNSAIPGDGRDTATPRGMGHLLHTMLFTPALSTEHQALLLQWLRNCKTGAGRIAAALPKGWDLAHKTGSGHNGTSNDLAVVWPDKDTPIILAIYLTDSPASAEERDAAIRKAATLILWSGF